MSNHKTNMLQLLGFALGCLLLTAVSQVADAAPGDLRYERRPNDSAEAVSELQSFPPSIFPHWVHRIHYRCDACHDSLFEMKHGGTVVTMDLMSKGKVCGACHDGETAFGSDFQTCNRCHVVSKE